MGWRHHSILQRKRANHSLEPTGGRRADPRSYLVLDTHKTRGGVAAKDLLNGLGASPTGVEVPCAFT